jgi:CRP/FNR family transcriptional regulator
MSDFIGINSCTIGRDHVCCFDDLTEEEINFINFNIVEVKYSKGETICKQGSFASHIMMITEGLAKIYIEEGNEILILKILPAVNLIGLASLYEGNNVFPYSAQAYVETTVKLIEINAFKDLLNKNGKFATTVLGLLAENTLITYGRFFCMTKKQTYGRLADVLLCLAQRVYKKDQFPLQLTRKELAELSSMSVESITRILTKFREDKIIRFESDHIEILDVERLTRISQSG